MKFDQTKTVIGLILILAAAMRSLLSKNHGWFDKAVKLNGAKYEKK